MGKFPARASTCEDRGISWRMDDILEHGQMPPIGREERCDPRGHFFNGNPAGGAPGVKIRRGHVMPATDEQEPVPV